jgi:hypothetical protein
MRSIALLTQKGYPFGGGTEPYRVDAYQKGGAGNPAASLEAAACRREARLGSCTERENLRADGKGKGTSGANRRPKVPMCR